MANYRTHLDNSKRLYAQAKEVMNKEFPTEAAFREAETQATQLIDDAEKEKQFALDMKALWEKMNDGLTEVEGIEMPGDGNAPSPTEEAARRQQMQRRQDNGKAFKYWGQFLKAIWVANSRNFLDDRLKHLRFQDSEEEKAYTREEKDMSGTTGATGGFLIPEEFRAEILSVMAERALVRPRATIIPMRRRTVRIPVLDQTDTTAGQPHWFGGMIFYWEDEAAEKTVTTPGWRDITLTARKLIGHTRSSDEMLDDAAVSLEAFLASPLGFAGGAAWMEDYAFLRGAGGNRPLGVLNAPCTLSGTRAGGGAVAYADLVGMLELSLPSARPIWLASQTTLSELMTMEGPSGNPSYIWTGGTMIADQAVNAPPTTLLGRPIIFTEKLPALGTAGDVLLADFSYYLIGDRQSPTIDTTIYARWEYDQTSWRLVHRVDGQPWLSTHLTFEDGSTQVSPFVMLAA